MWFFQNRTGGRVMVYFWFLFALWPVVGLAVALLWSPLHQLAEASTLSETMKVMEGTSGKTLA
jgi:hypothetical protein